jgi:DNA-binding transcriptional LysR family regulator
VQIDAFKVFCDLAETESFTRSASINGVTQSAVSQQISSLERQFKARLVERSKKLFRLTREGQVLYDYSKQILQAYEGLHGRLQEIKDIVSGTIRVAAIYSIGLHWLPPYLKQYLKTYPTVNVHVAFRHADQIYQDVAGNVVDLGLVAFPTKDAKLEVVPMAREPMVLICHPQHPLAKHRSVGLASLAREKVVAFAHGLPTREATDKLLRSHGVTVHPVMEFDNIETVKRAVEIEAGVALVPANTVVQEVAKQTLAQVELADAEFGRPTAMLYKKNKVLSPAMKRFIALLQGGA